MAEARIDQSDPNATRRLFTAMALSLAIYSGYVWWKGPPKPVIDPAAPPVAAAPVSAPEPTPAASLVALPPLRELPLQACDLSGTWTTEGGVLRQVALSKVEGPYPVTQLWQWVAGRFTGSKQGSWTPYGSGEKAAVALSSQAHALAVGAGPLTNSSPRMEILESSTGGVTFRGITAAGIEVTEKITSGGDPCVLNAEFSWKNTGDAPYSAGLWVGLHDILDKDATYGTHLFPVAYVTGALDYTKLANIIENPEASEGPVSWFSISDRFFGTFVLPKDPTAGRLFFSSRQFMVDGVGQVQYGSHWVHSEPLGVGETYVEPMRVYMGALDKDVLGLVDPTLPKAINYSWMAAFATPMLWALKLIHGFVGNWGLAIIGLTIAVKAALFPLITTGMKSSMKMAAVQPQMTAIRAEFKDDPEEMNRRVMAPLPSKVTSTVW